MVKTKNNERRRKNKETRKKEKMPGRMWTDVKANYEAGTEKH
jgi:hypothetical protein